MNYSEFTQKIQELYEENEFELIKAMANEPPVPIYHEADPDDLAKLRHTGGGMKNIEYLPFCKFNMSNEAVKWLGYADDAPASVKFGYIQYAYDLIRTLNYGLNMMIDTASEDFARRKYNKKIEEGGELFMSIVKDLLI